jgi:hypothetical protein
MLCRQNASFFMLKHVDWCIIIKMSDWIQQKTWKH